MGWFDEGVGGFFSTLFGSQNKDKVDPNDPRFNVDQNAYNYGGSPTGARDAANRYKNAAEWGQTRTAAQANYGQANEDRARALQARQGQEQAANLMMQRATGAVPSIARMAADRQMGQAVAAQRAQQASARGPAGLALAGRTAAGNIANAQSAIANQGQINEAQERLAAEQAAFGAQTGMRGLDYQGQQQAAQQGQFNAQLEAQQRALNDQFSLGMTGFEHGVNQSQLGAQMQGQAQQQAGALGAAGINAGVGGQNAAMNQANAWGAINAGAGVAGGLGQGSGGPKPRAAGGPVAPNEPYLVGERGPELIVPQHAGMVIPADETAQVMSTWGTGEAAPLSQDNSYRAAISTEKGRGLVRMANETESPWARDVRQVRTLRQVAPNLVNEEDDERERRGLLVMRQAQREKPKGDAKGERAEATKGTEEVARGGRLAALGNAAGNAARTIDTSYRGPSAGYQPPPMVVLPAARAAGGPMMPGSPYMVGEQGPEMVLPAGLLGMQRSASAPAMSGPASPSFAGSSGMLGGSPMGELRAHSAFATRFASDPTAQAREKGGPVAPGKKYLVGEKGPELVVDTSKAELGEIQRMRSPTMFKRDTPQDQAAVKKGYYDQAGRDADAMLAGYTHSLNQGSAVGPVVEIDQEPAPWLTAFMATQQSPSALVAAREEGGPVAKGQPTLVGEKGAEIIVPAMTRDDLTRHAKGAAMDAVATAMGPVGAIMERDPDMIIAGGSAPLYTTLLADERGVARDAAKDTARVVGGAPLALMSALARMRGR